MATFTALFDACVFYPAPLRDLLVSLAGEDMFLGRWTEAIHEEWTRNVIANRPDLTPEKILCIPGLINNSVEDCLITDYEDLIPSLTLPDPDDRHVLAAAIKGRVDVIVTLNLKDFPSNYLRKFGVEAQHPDVFVKHLLGLYPNQVCFTLKEMRERLKKPPKTVDEMLVTLEKNHLTQTVEHLKAWKDLL